MRRLELECAREGLAAAASLDELDLELVGLEAQIKSANELLPSVPSVEEIVKPKRRSNLENQLDTTKIPSKEAAQPATAKEVPPPQPKNFVYQFALKITSFFKSDGGSKSQKDSQLLSENEVPQRRVGRRGWRQPRL